MTAASEYGFTIGQRVEARIDDHYTGENHEWRPAVITEFYSYDDGEPIKVTFDDTPGNGWYCKVANVRAITEPQAPRIEYRTRATTHMWSDYKPIPVGGSLNIRYDVSIEFREAPAKTDADILAELRKRVDDGRITSPNVRTVLKGDF